MPSQEKTLSKYYSDRNVRLRLLEFLGARRIEDVTAAFITADDASADVQYWQRPVSDLWNSLEAGHEVGRSLWDRSSLIVDLDIEYVNFDFPREPFLQPQRAFELQRPIVQCIEQRLLNFGITPVHFVSGRGHHFFWKIDQQSEAFQRLYCIGQLSDSLYKRYQQPHPIVGARIGETLGLAYSGLGMVLEHLAHTVINTCQHETAIPIQITAVEVGPGEQGREIVSIDLSEYGDDLYTRSVRMPFSVYLKPDQQRYCLGDSFVDALPSLFSIPLHEMDISQAIETMRSADRVVELAASASVRIPNCSESMLGLVNEYSHSKLGEFHDSFYREQYDPPAAWPDTYDRTPLECLPRCISDAVSQPNELLLKPAAIQNVVRAFLSIGWSPRHIAGLVRSKYERDYGWGDKWFRYDASSRADFYVRLFAGQIWTGVDSLVDFNCQSNREKKYCPDNQCAQNLVDLRPSLEERIHSR